MKNKSIIYGILALVSCVLIASVFVLRNTKNDSESETITITRDDGSQEELPIIGYATTVSVRDGKEVEIEVPIPNLDVSLARDEEDEIIITDENFDHAIGVFVQEFFWGDPEYDLTGVELVHVIEAKSECSENRIRHARFEKNGEFAGHIELSLTQDRWKWDSVNFTNASLKDGVEFRFDSANEIPKTIEESRKAMFDQYQVDLPYVGSIMPCIDGQEATGGFHVFGDGEERVLSVIDNDAIFTQSELEESWAEHAKEEEYYYKMWEEEDIRERSTLPQRLEEAHQQLHSHDFEKREEALSIISDSETLIDVVRNHNDENTRHVALERMASIDSDKEDLCFADTMYITLVNTGSSTDERETALLYFEDAVEYAPEKSFEFLEQIMHDSVLTADEYNYIVDAFDDFEGSCDNIGSCRLLAQAIQQHEHFSLLLEGEQKMVNELM